MIRYCLIAAAVAALAPAMATAQQDSGGPFGATASPADPWNGGPQGVRAQEHWIEMLIRHAVTAGDMETDQSSSALNELADIRNREAVDRANGPLSEPQRIDLNNRLDALHMKVTKAIRHNAVRSY